jgi:hypothetical protein
MGSGAAESVEYEIGGLPPTVAPRVRNLLDRLDELRVEEGKGERRIDPSLLLPSQNPTVLSILGEQGVGKSTTLKYVCDHAMRDPKRLVLPVVSPERFAEGDTLFGWVLSALTELLPKQLPEASEREAPEYREGLTMSELADLLCRQEALARKSHGASAVIGSAHPDEWAESIAAVTAAGLQLVRGWAALLEGLATDIDQLVIPVDDADQVPSLLGGVLRDLRWLTLDPLVAVVVCANDEMLLQALQGEPELGVMDPIPRRRHAVGIMTKALPRHLRLSVSPLQPPERLEFRPPGESESLMEILRRCPIEGVQAVDPDSLGDLFELALGDETIASPYTELLPGTPRQLVQLWNELRSTVASDTPELAGEAAKCLVEEAVERARDRSPDLPDDSIRIFDGGSQGLSVEFDFSEMKSGWTVGAGRSVYRHEANRVSMRRIDGFPLHPTRGEDESRPPQETLPGDFSNAHYLAMDLTDPDGSNRMPFYLWGYVRSLSLPGGANWNATVEVEYEYRPTDHCFALVPDWEGRYDYLLYAAAWNSIWNTLKDVGPEPSPTLLEWLLLKHVSLVIDVQANRAISPAVMDETPRELENLDVNWQRDEIMEFVAEQLENLYRTPGGRSTREGDFAEWVDTLLPSIADPVLAVPEFAAQILDIRKRLLRKHPGALERANQRCADFLAARIRRDISSDWVTHTMQLLRKFDPIQADNLEGLHAVARDEADSELKALETTLERRGIPRSMVGEMFFSGVTPEIEHKLMLQGMPPAAIEALAVRFGRGSELDSRATPEAHPDA